MLERIAEMKAVICCAYAATVTAILNFIGTDSKMAEFLISVMVIDYITGLMLGVMHKSRKSKTGKLNSIAGFKGLMKKGGILLVVYLAVKLDMLLAIHYSEDMVISFFIANEAISILENLGTMGVKYPKKLRKAIEALSEEEEHEN